MALLKWNYNLHKGQIVYNNERTKGMVNVLRQAEFDFEYNEIRDSEIKSDLIGPPAASRRPVAATAT